MECRGRLVAAIVVVFAVGATLPAVCDDRLGDEEWMGRCRVDGAWVGTSPAWSMTWIITYTSNSPWAGHYTLQFLGGDPTMGGAFPTVVEMSNTVGTFVRTGSRASQYTMITYGLDAQGQPVYIAKNSGSSEMSWDCTTMEVFDSAIEFYDASQDPFGDDPPAYGCAPDPSVSYAHRMHVDPPCELPSP
jgi:hypothetical protein